MQLCECGASVIVWMLSRIDCYVSTVFVLYKHHNIVTTKLLQAPMIIELGEYRLPNQEELSNTYGVSSTAQQREFSTLPPIRCIVHGI